MTAERILELPEPHAGGTPGPTSTPRAGLIARATRRSVAVGHWMRWRWRFGAFGHGTVLSRPDLIAGSRNIHIGSRVHIWKGARLEAIDSGTGRPSLSIGDGTSIHMYFHCGAARSVTIGRDVLIAGHVYVSDHDHDPGRPGLSARRSTRLSIDPVVIEDDCWLGEGCRILKGVTLGRGSVVGASSVVTRDVPPYTMVVGAPARQLRRWDEASERWIPVIAGADER